MWVVSDKLVSAWALSLRYDLNLKIEEFDFRSWPQNIISLLEMQFKSGAGPPDQTYMVKSLGGEDSKTTITLSCPLQREAR